MDKYISKVTDYMSTGEGLSMWLLTYTASLLAGYKCCIGLIFISSYFSYVVKLFVPTLA